MRVVIMAEGAWELKGRAGPAPAPGEPIAEDALGPAHLLVRRALVERADVPQGAVRFEAPLRVQGREARGSDLLDRATLRRLLSWPRPAMRPDLAVLFVDADGDHQRGPQLGRHVDGLPATPVIGVAVQEFEAWLLADGAAVRRVFGEGVSVPPTPERLGPGEAKRTFQALCGARPALSGREARTSVARQLDLDLLATGSRSFERFLRDLRARLDV